MCRLDVSTQPLLGPLLSTRVQRSHSFPSLVFSTFFGPPPPIPSLFFPRLGCCGSRSSDPRLPLCTGPAAPAFRFPRLGFPAGSFAAWVKPPRPGRPPLHKHPPHFRL